MAWIEKRTNWLKAEVRGQRSEGREQRELSVNVYSISDAARVLKVDKRTIMKWMEYDEDDLDSAIIPPSAWFKLPNGYIRIEEWIIIKLMNP
jgi:hypothetical protein